MIKENNMNRPYIICHMVTSIDGKVTGNFLSQENSGTDVYYQINRDCKADGYACGRVTMQGNFCETDSLALFENTKSEHSRENERKQKKIGGFNKPPILV